MSRKALSSSKQETARFGNRIDVMVSRLSEERDAHSAADGLTRRPTQPAVEVRDISKSYGRVAALRSVSFSLAQGSCLGVVGPNGAGKTTLFRILAGLIPRFDGEVLILGEDVRAKGSLGLGALIEQPAYYPYLTVRENLDYLATIGRLAPESVSTAVSAAGLEGVSERKAGVLSHGTKQRLGIAIALLSDPEVLILDEPLTGLDPTGQVEIRRLLASYLERGRTVLVSTHNLAEIESVADRLLFLSSGKPILVGDLEELTAANVALIRFRRSEGNYEAAINLLQGLGYTVARWDETTLKVRIEKPETDALVRALASGNLYPTEVILQQRSLEEVYLDLLGDGSVDDQ